MEQEDVKVQQTAEFIRETVPIRDELFDTLCVTNQTERLAVKVSFLIGLRLFKFVQNAADLQTNYRRRINELVKVRNRLQDEIKVYYESYKNAQEQKKAKYDEIRVRLEEMELADAEAEMERINNL